MIVFLAVGFTVFSPGMFLSLFGYETAIEKGGSLLRDCLASFVRFSLLSSTVRCARAEGLELHELIEVLPV